MMARKNQNPTPDELLDSELAAASAQPDAPPVPQVTPSKAAPAVAPLPDAAPKLRRYRVKATKMLSIQGYITHLSKGDVIGEDSYGPSGMASILSSGIELEELP